MELTFKQARIKKKIDEMGSMKYFMYVISNLSAKFWSVITMLLIVLAVLLIIAGIGHPPPTQSVGPNSGTGALQYMFGGECAIGSLITFSLYVFSAFVRRCTLK